MSHHPAESLRSRTFVGLLIAQFLAAFNDQAIHAAAMFFAFHKGTLTEAQAISLMPILFYAPWALFCTVAGYFADRFSKRDALVFWKFAEIVITLVALVGFYLGSVQHLRVGPVLVLATVFLMGTHSAFFVPAKYGAMPEILAPSVLSRGNGVLESLSFFAVILGTVAGGVLSFFFQHRETVIGGILVTLAVIGAAASLFIRRMPAANPEAPFPRYVYGPLAHSLRQLVAPRTLRVAVIGIAFFTFVVAFMRATVYMLGESQNPRWNEFKTSVVVGMSALGIAAGSPLAGWLSGRKVELGLVPLGAAGMVVAALAAAGTLALAAGPALLAGLIACIIALGFFTGFYIVPLFTLLQHRAPKASKGDAVATSNLINVSGAILASLVFFLVVRASQLAGVTPVVAGHADIAAGTMKNPQYDRFGRPVYFEVETGDGTVRHYGTPNRKLNEQLWEPDEGDEPTPKRLVIETVDDPKAGDPVAVSGYDLRGVTYHIIRPAGAPLPVEHDMERLPRYLFLGAAAVTLVTLLLLIWQMPDLPARSRWLVRALGVERRLRVYGTHHVPTDGPTVLVTNCRAPEDCIEVQTAIDRTVRFITPPLPAAKEGEAAATIGAVNQAMRALDDGFLVGLTAPAQGLLPQLQARVTATVLPVYYGHGEPGVNGEAAKIGSELRVSFGDPLPPHATLDEVRGAIRAAAGALDDT
jgi:MFS family permease